MGERRQLVQHAAEGPDVRLVGVALLAHQLWAHVEGRAHAGTCEIGGRVEDA